MQITEDYLQKKTEQTVTTPSNNPPELRTPPTADCIVLGNQPKDFDLHAPELFLNRELTWLNFNWRVLAEAQDPRVPLLERWRFLIIVASNLDEFIMKRIGGLMIRQASDDGYISIDGRTPLQQIYDCNLEVARMQSEWRRQFSVLNTLMKEEGLGLYNYEELDQKSKQTIRDFYIENIFPMVTPQATGPAHSFPFISNQSLNLLVTVSAGIQESVVRVKIPISREVSSLVKADNNQFVPLEQVVANNLDLLFPGSLIKRCDYFRVIRNANTERDDDSAEDLLAFMESEIRERQFAPVVRLEVNQEMPNYLRRHLTQELDMADGAETVEISSIMYRRDLASIADADFPRLKYIPHKPVTPAFSQHSIIQAIRQRGSVLVHHPYDSFRKSVLRFLKEAARDPKVKAIKMSLYRTDRKSKIVSYLSQAARNGKQVAVAVELKARFDEKANIDWARHLEREGIHVTYGVMGLKTHCKTLLVVRLDDDGLRRYIHFGTGNYHSETANQYSDIGIFTCDKNLGEDATQLFNYLTTGIAAKRPYKKLLTSPDRAKSGLIYKIEREISLHTPTTPGLIEIKTNALEDSDLTRALYRASQAGVRVNLLVRDTCRLRPGITGLSENIRVVSIVGRFLEHARIYHFLAGGKHEYYIGSADAMTRNLESRVETLVPVEDFWLQSQLQEIFDTQLADQRSAWEMQSDGSYVRRQPSALSEKTALSSQQRLIDLSELRARRGI